jgi:DNA polymerase gamma 1
MIQRDGFYEKPPHDNENSIVVLLCKEYSTFFDQEILTSESPEAKVLVAKAISMSYWTSTRGRVQEQLAVDGYNHFTGLQTKTIVPGLVVHGTVTRRGMEPLWLTVTSAKSHRIGTELKSRISAPENCVFVQADQDGQELRIASMLADSVKSYIGSSLMSFSVIAGDKNQGTDPHTKLAKLIETCRDTAKTCYYALIYGAGLKTLIASFKGEHRGASNESLRATAQKIVGYRKGKKERGSKVYVGGTDSAAFTMMEKISGELVPRTPVLGSAMTTPMRPQHVGTEFHTGRCNWTVQSSAVDQLHIFITALEYLYERYSIRGKFIWAYHDEMLAVVHKDDAKQAAWLFQVAHCWCWAYTAKKLCIADLPLSGAFFSGVAVDGYFRKSVSQSLVTPSNLVEPSRGVDLQPADFIQISKNFNKQYSK